MRYVNFFFFIFLINIIRYMRDVACRLKYWMKVLIKFIDVYI
jgi:hypothetical protein